MMLSLDQALEAMEAALGHRFKEQGYLVEALTHRSAVSGREARRGRRAPRSKGAGSNERLEFIGDRVLGLLMAEWLFERYPDEQEGALGPRHAHLVSRPVLADIADQVGLSEALRISPHEEEAGIRRLSSIRADAMEALLGALYLDAGLGPARRVVREQWAERIESDARPHKEPKTRLQEYLLARALPLPVYDILAAEGPSHAPIFRVSVTACGKTGIGEAGSKRQAESMAASDLLARLGQNKTS
ncbi:ribonuclease III [Neokomagataea thailandica NBRC 106555]|uniref:Ribonuclease 3 n=2 Tax=Neokomagataea TaxID=1223423 RepID=A0A4Y6V629_9PROT|nr:MULTISPECIES: ribonuclease III [Neokomagataea]QDH24824.1 ribonuclease III [Neokomagataea tanensis]GBR50056.1 ribonuclease III [Neokomagataea thailandica NBRC 106555]